MWIVEDRDGANKPMGGNFAARFQMMSPAPDIRGRLQFSRRKWRCLIVLVLLGVTEFTTSLWLHTSVSFSAEFPIMHTAIWLL